MRITRKQVRELMRESLIDKGVIVTEQMQQQQSFVPEAPVAAPEMEVDVDRDELINTIAETLWEDALLSMVEEGKAEGWIPHEVSHESIVAQLEDSRPTEVDREAGDFLNALEGHAGKSVGEIAADLRTDDVEALGYYIPMQMQGHGVAWSDSREGNLDTPNKEAMESHMAAEYAVKSAFNATTPEEWDLNR